MEKSSFESMQEFFYLWLKTYEATFGRLAEMPAMGPAREKSEKMMKTEIDEINKELDSLKGTVGELTSQIKEYLMNPPKKGEYSGIHKTKKK